MSTTHQDIQQNLYNALKLHCRNILYSPGYSFMLLFFHVANRLQVSTHEYGKWKHISSVNIYFDIIVNDELKERKATNSTESARDDLREKEKAA